MKIAFTATGTTLDSAMNARFGRTEYLLCYDTDTKELQGVNNGESVQAAHGAGPLAVQKLAELKADVLVTGNGPGEKAGALLRNLDIKVYGGAGSMRVEEALAAFEQGALTEIAL